MRTKAVTDVLAQYLKSNTKDKGNKGKDNKGKGKKGKGKGAEGKGKNDKGKGKGKKGKGAKVGAVQKTIVKTVKCKFWAVGTCSKGDSCTFHPLL